MRNSATLYKRHRFPSEIIQYAVWLYHRFNLSHRDIEDLLAEKGVVVTHESIRLWCIKFGPKYAKKLRRQHQGYGDTFFLDEVFVSIQGKQRYLWRAIDQDGEVVDFFYKLVEMVKLLSASLNSFSRNTEINCGKLSLIS